MSSFKNVISNIWMPTNDSFGTYHSNTLYSLLVGIQNDFSLSLGKPIDMSIQLFLEYRPDNPQCCKIPDGHLIFLSTQGDEWWRWVFQFSHEYCHSLINGASTGDITGLIWFEETVCHLASVYQLNNLIALCETSPNPHLKCHREVACLCLSANFGEPQDNCREYLLSLADLLAQSEYQRAIYSNLAVTMLPLFVENRNLWKIILHFGDMRQWKSLSDLFAHLRLNADDSYANSLSQLEKMLLG